MINLQISGETFVLSIRRSKDTPNACAGRSIKIKSHQNDLFKHLLCFDGGKGLITA